MNQKRMVPKQIINYLLQLYVSHSYWSFIADNQFLAVLIVQILTELLCQIIKQWMVLIFGYKLLKNILISKVLWFMFFCSKTVAKFSYQIYLLFTRHADIPESCLRYMGAMVDDVIILDHEVRKPFE